MIDYKTTNAELGRLAGILDEYGDVISAGRIRQLMIAIGGDPSAEDWAATNIQSVIDPEAITDGLKSRSAPARWIGFLEWVRNWLVIVPLMLTWLGISLASQKYQELVNANTTQEQHSFLYLWQQGFNHTLPDPFILNNLALTDFLLLALILILTLVTTWQHHLFNTQNEKRAEQLRTSLSHALGDAALCMAMTRRQRQINQPSNLNDIAKYLHQTMQKFFNEMEEERKRWGDLKTFMAALDKMSKDMLKAASSIEQTNASLTTTLQEILVPVKEIPKLATAAGQAIAEMNNMNGQLGRLVADHGKWHQELQTVMANGLNQLIAEQKQANIDMRGTVDGALRQMNASLAQQIAEQARIGQDLHTMMNNSFNQLLTEQQELGKALIDAARDLEAGVQVLGNIIPALQKAATDQAQVVASLHTLQAEQRNLTSEMTAATGEIKNVLKSVRESTPELRSIAVDTNRIANALKAMPNTLHNDLIPLLSVYSGAADKLNTGSNTLGRAAQYLENVTHKLDGQIKKP